MGVLESMIKRMEQMEELLKKANSAPVTVKPEEEHLYKRKEAAAFLKVSLVTLDMLTNTGKLPTYRINGTDQKRFKYSDLMKTLKLVEAGEEW